MGFGHRVYRAEDPRARVLRRTAQRARLAARRGRRGARGGRAARRCASARPTACSRRTSSSGPRSCSSIADIPPRDVPADVRLRARRRLVGAHHRAAAHRPADPPVGALRRPALAPRGRDGLTPPADARGRGRRGERARRAGRRARARRPARGVGRGARGAARSADYRERAVAYRAIGQFRFRQKIELLRRGLEDESPACRGSALLSLELLSRDHPGDVNAVRPLLHELATHDDNQAVRRLAIMALRNGSPPARHDRDPHRARRGRRAGPRAARGGGEGRPGAAQEGRPGEVAGSAPETVPLPPLSVLDLAFVPTGSSPAGALRNTLDLAQHVERWGYTRYWLAEHHNMIGIASAATVDRDRARRGRHEDDPGRRGRHHAAEPFAARDRGAVRHARVAVPRANRPRPRPRAGHGPAHSCARCGGARWTRSRFRKTCSSCQAYFGELQPGQVVQARSRCRPQGAALDPGLEPVRRSARRGARAAVCVRIALRAGRPDARARNLSVRTSGRRRSSTNRMRWWVRT